MLKFYYHPVSINARRVWVALLEKQIPFEAVQVDLNGAQFGEDFTAINPFQRVPVIVDAGFRVVESLAILDYLEAKYPAHPLMPSQPEEIAIVRMVEMIAVNELQPATMTLTRRLVGLEVGAQKLEQAKERVIYVMGFYEELLRDHLYFVGNELTLADIVAGTLVSALPMFGFSLDDYPHLKTWVDQLAQRESWQRTEPPLRVIQAALPGIKKILERRS